MNLTRTRLALGSVAAACLLGVAACGGSSSADPLSPSVTAGQAQQQVRQDNQAAPANVYTATLLAALPEPGQLPAGLSTAMGTGVVLTDPQRELLRASVTLTGMQPEQVVLRLAADPIAPAAEAPAEEVLALTETAPGSGLWTVQTRLSAAQAAALNAGDYLFEVSSAAPVETLRGQVRSSLPGGPHQFTLQNQEALQQATAAGNTTGETVITETVVDQASGQTISQSRTIRSSDNGQTVTEITEASTAQAESANIITVNGQPASEQGSVRLTMLTNVLSAAQQVPAQQSTALAVSVVILDQVSGRMRVSLTSLGVEGSAAHIHQGTPGNNGPVLFPLAQTAPGSGTWDGAVEVNSAQADALLKGGFYVDVHTAAAPQGLLRGQILQQGGVITVTGQRIRHTSKEGDTQVDIDSGNRSVITQ